MRLILVAGSTETAAIDGISAAGADPDAMVHTPSADAEIVAYGATVRSPVVPVSPTGCPTPAAVTRACRSLANFETTVVDGGLAEGTAAPTVTVGARRGRDVRERDPVPTAPGAFAAARQFGEALPDEEVVLGETIPGGTTTAMGVLRALGEEWTVSSSLPDNPLPLKSQVVENALAASDLEPGDCAGDPVPALRRMGDPVLAVVAGIAVGALTTGTRVVLGGGTQMLAAAAVVRHAGVDAPLSLATTSFVADDVDDLPGACGSLDVGLTVTDPGFDGRAEESLARYVAGEAKEGAGMGGALALADRAGVLGAVPDETLAVVRGLEG
ncbi:MAG: nicotinate-nucleotide--dimethylbenzimidazole phosphoribosyltransferase [Haloferacaceae archaeon]